MAGSHGTLQLDRAYQDSEQSLQVIGRLSGQHPLVTLRATMDRHFVSLGHFIDIAHEARHSPLELLPTHLFSRLRPQKPHPMLRIPSSPSLTLAHLSIFIIVIIIFITILFSINRIVLGLLVVLIVVYGYDFTSAILLHLHHFRIQFVRYKYTHSTLN